MFQIQRTVGSSHLDSEGHLRLSSAVDFMQDCCCFHLDSEKELTRYFQKNKVTMFLISRQIDLLKPAYYGDQLYIRTSIYQLRASYGYRNTMIYNDKEELLIASYAGGAFIDMEKGGATVLPADITETLTFDTRYEDMEYLPRKVRLPKEPAEQIFPRTPVFHFYIDHNRHVNNARYIDIAQEYLPDHFSFGTCRIEYKTAAKYGDFIIPIRYFPSAHTCLISLQGTGGEVFANVEFRK